MNNFQNSPIPDGTIFQHRAGSELIAPNFPELYRFAGIADAKKNEPDEALQKLAKDAAEEIAQAMNCRSVYIRFPLSISDTEKNGSKKKHPAKKIKFAQNEIESSSLALNLENCHSVFLFAATLGPNVDKAIQKASRINPAKSVLLQAAGAMYIEEYCNHLEQFLLEQEEKAGNRFKPRFSPGYGDVSLDVQNIFFELLCCQKNIALTLNDSLIMSPEKSVTAFIGVTKK